MSRPSDRRRVPCPAAAFAAFLALASLLAVPGAMAANGDCGQPLSSGTGPNASDCSFILKAAVGATVCELCVCDVNGSQSQTTVDALLCLKRAVGQSVPLDCPSCGPVTTTTLGTNSTTSTSTTSSTTTIPVRCGGNGDCAELPDGFRCNPNTDTCEKPCTKNTDCKDFYECNKTTGYCQEPALQF